MNAQKYSNKQQQMPSTESLAPTAELNIPLNPQGYVAPKGGVSHPSGYTSVPMATPTSAASAASLPFRDNRSAFQK